MLSRTLTGIQSLSDNYESLVSEYYEDEFTSDNSTLFVNSEIQKLAGVGGDENRPNAIILGYPVIIAVRISNEEKVLTEQLKGYAEYKQKVKYKIIPFVW